MTGRSGAALRERASKLQTVHLGHAQVGDERVERLVVEAPCGIRARRARGGVVAVVGEAFGQGIGHFRLVVHDEDSRARPGGRVERRHCPTLKHRSCPVDQRHCGQCVSRA